MTPQLKKKIRTLGLYLKEKFQKEKYKVLYIKRNY